MRLYSGAGQPVELGQILGRGGEGAVHDIAGRPGFVAKIYHQPLDADKTLKLENMARQAHPGLLDIAAWPVDVLRASPEDPVQGFIMPRVGGYREIHSLYGPAHRKKAFPQADWSFLVHAARNLASAFSNDVCRRAIFLPAGRLGGSDAVGCCGSGDFASCALFSRHCYPVTAPGGIPWRFAASSGPTSCAKRRISACCCAVHVAAIFPSSKTAS